MTKKGAQDPPTSLDEQALDTPLEDAGQRLGQRDQAVVPRLHEPHLGPHRRQPCTRLARGSRDNATDGPVH